MKKIILASNSPRRKELLKAVGLSFEVFPDDTPEPRNPDLSPKETVMFLAKFKGDNVAEKLKEDAVIISADTIVSIENQILGKPKNKNEAFAMLLLLSGKAHSVYTGVYIREKETGKSVNFYEKTDVYFKNLDINEIKDYINNGEPMDKAGAYGIQNLGSLFVEKNFRRLFQCGRPSAVSFGKRINREFWNKILLKFQK